MAEQASVDLNTSVTNVPYLWESNREPLIQNVTDNEDETQPLLGNSSSAKDDAKGGANAPVTANLAFSVFAIVLGSFQFGYQTGVINAPFGLLKNFIRNVSAARSPDNQPLADSQVTVLSSLLVAMYTVGGLFGAVVGGLLAKRVGRRLTLIINNIPILIGSGLMLGSYWAASYEVLIVGRFVVGIGGGVATTVAPVYLAEISPAALRGAIGTLHQVSIVVAIVLSQLLGLRFLLATTQLWPYLLAFSIVPAVIQLLMLLFVWESPRFLLAISDDVEAARAALIALRGVTLPDLVEEEIGHMRSEAAAQRAKPNVSLKDLLLTPHLRWALLISVVLHVSQQLSGINAVINYSSELFKQARLSADAAAYATLGTGLVNLLVTLVSVVLVDRLGRRTLHLGGQIGQFVMTLLLTGALLASHKVPALSYGSIVCVFLYLCCFAVGPGSIPWFMVAEMFAIDARPMAVSIAVVVNWVGAAAVGLGYPQLLSYLKDFSFLPFAVILLLCNIFNWLYMLETKNRSVEEIESDLRRQTDTLVDAEDLPPGRATSGYERLSA